MPWLGELLRPFAEPLAPLLRQRVLHALRGFPGAVSLGEIALEGARVRLRDLVLDAGDYRVVARSIALRVRPQRWITRSQAELCLEELEGAIEVAPRGPFLGVQAQLVFRASGRRDHWVDGHVVLTAGALTLSGAVTAGEHGATLGDLRVVGEHTNLRGALRLAADRQVAPQVDHQGDHQGDHQDRRERLSGSLAGVLAARDLPLGALPVDLRELTATLSVALSGTLGAPVARVGLDLGGTPLRAPGQRRFLPHLRVERGRVEATLTGGAEARFAFEATIEPNGGGRLAVSGEGANGTGGTGGTGRAHRGQASIEGLTATTVQHLLTLARVPDLTVRGGPFSGNATLEHARIEATLAATEATLAIGAATFPLLEARLQIDGSLGAHGALDAPALAFALEASLDGGAVRLAQPVGGPLELTVRDASPRVLARLVALDPGAAPLLLEGEGPAPPGVLVLPAGLRVDLDARPAHDALHARITLAGEGSRVVVVLDARDGAHQASRVSGTLTTTHARVLLDLTTRLPGLSVTGSPLDLELAVLGASTPGAAVALVGKVRTEGLTATLAGRALSVGAGAVSLHVAPTWLAFEELELRVGQGCLRGAGVALLDGATPRARCHFACADTRVGRRELFPEGAPIDGRAFAHAALRLGRGGVHTLRAEVHLRLERPTYTFLPRATAGLARLRLPRIPTQGDTALEAHAVLESGRVEVRAFRASVPGLRASGHGEADASDGRVAGELALVVDRAWLSQSPLYALPGALLGWIDLPIRLRGSLERPEARSALGQAILKSLTRDLGARRAAGPLGALALGPRSLPIAAEPFEPGAAGSVRTLVRGALPPDALASLARRFVDDE